MAPPTESPQGVAQSEPIVPLVTPGSNSSQADSQDSDVSYGTKMDDDADAVSTHIAQKGSLPWIAVHQLEVPTLCGKGFKTHI